MIRKLLLLARGFFEGVKEPIKQLQAATLEEQPMQQQIVYAEFEEAIGKWEKRTGKKVEREFKEPLHYEENGKHIVEFNGSAWVNFAEFLGSREAFAYRRKWKVTFADILKEMEQGMPQMHIADEEDFEAKLDELRKNGL